jgi:hypothetical protein
VTVGPGANVVEESTAAHEFGGTYKGRQFDKGSANFHLQMTVPCHHEDVGSVSLEKIGYQQKMAVKYYRASRRSGPPIEPDLPKPIH